MSRTRYTLAYDHNNMVPSPGTSTTEQIIWETEDGIMIVYGNTVPTDAASGYAIGCLFIHSDGSAGGVLYINEGTASSCDFNLTMAEDNLVTALQDATYGLEGAYPNSGTAAGKGPSPLIWDGAPILDLILNPTDGFYFFDDFMGPIDVTTGDGWTLTQVTSGAIAPVATEAGGVLLFDSNGNAGADDGLNAQLTNCMVKPVAGTTIYFETRVKMNDTSVNISQFFIGLAGVDTTLIAAGVVDDVVDKAGFFRHAATTADKLSVINSRTTEEEISADKATVADATYVKLGMVIDGITSVKYYVNGALVDTHVTANAIPNAVMCLSAVAQTEGASKDAELSIDWVRILQSGSRA